MSHEGDRVVCRFTKDVILDAPEHTTEMYPEPAEIQRTRQHFGIDV